MSSEILKQIDALLNKDKISSSDFFIKIHIVDTNLSEKISREIKLKDLSEFIEKSEYYVQEMEIGFKSYSNLLCMIFPKCTFDDMENYRNGRTDFILYDENNNMFYVELKYNGDKLSLPQISWNIENKDKKIFYLFIDSTVYSGSQLMSKFKPGYDPITKKWKRSVFS